MADGYLSYAIYFVCVPTFVLEVNNLAPTNVALELFAAKELDPDEE